MGGAGRNAAPGALAKIVSDDMPDGVAVHSIKEILGWIGCMPPHVMHEMERLGGPLQRRSRFLVRGTFIFASSQQIVLPTTYARSSRRRTGWTKTTCCSNTPTTPVSKRPSGNRCRRPWAPCSRRSRRPVHRQRRASGRLGAAPLRPLRPDSAAAVSVLCPCSSVVCRQLWVE